MKKNQLIKTLAFFCVLSNSFFMPSIQAQHVENSPAKPSSKNFLYYSKKNKNQKTTAWIMLGGGAVLTVSGLALISKELLIDPWSGDEVNPIGGEIMGYAGLASMAGSIPFFIASGKNKKRAKISLQQQKITMGNKISQQSNYHSICLSISLGK
jgi:hypothetical protein